MKHHLKKTLILIPLMLIATGAYAAYSFVGPTAAPTGNNTDGPVDISNSNQVKNGDLSVNAFQVVTGSQFAQQSQFTGLVNGGTSTSTNSTITFGNSSDKTSVANTGSTAIAGYYQSSSLKTTGGLKPVCADKNGMFFTCGSSATNNVNPIYIIPNMQSSTGQVLVGASLSEPTNANVIVTISAVALGTQSSGGGNAINFIKNQFTAHAVAYGVCYYNATPKVVGTVTILGSSTTSDTVPLPVGCDETNTTIIISSYSPTTTMGGRPLIAE